MTKNKVKSSRFFGIPLVFPYLKNYRKLVFAMITCGLISSGVDVVLPMFREYALNHFVANETLDTLAYFIVTYVLTVLAAGICNYVSCYYAMHNEVSINRDLRRDAFNHLQNLSFSYFNQNSVGYIHARVMSDTSRIGSLMSWTMMDSVWHFSYLVGAIVVMFVKNARLALLVCAIVPVAALLFAVFQGKLTRLNREIREMNSKITGDFN
ncbi:MAG: ABC transporter ATP-binding protein, partial [Clostridia bacterium]|nr:ABC transporter ATP-binding protein [Clostridia bacterium]